MQTTTAECNDVLDRVWRPLSPFVRKVRVCLNEKGLDYRLETVMPFTPPQWYYELNPLGRIPALKDGDDCTLADSSVICQYLEEAYSDTPSLYGGEAQQRGQIRWLEKYADYELAPLTTFTVFRNRILKPMSGQACNEEAVQAALQQNCRRISTISSGSWVSGISSLATSYRWRISP